MLRGVGEKGNAGRITLPQEFVLIWGTTSEFAVHVDGHLKVLDGNFIDLLESEVRELLRC